MPRSPGWRLHAAYTAQLGGTDGAAHSEGRAFHAPSSDDRGHAGLGDIFHPVHGAAANVEDQRHGQPFGELDVQVTQIAGVILAADQIARKETDPGEFR